MTLRDYWQVVLRRRLMVLVGVGATLFAAMAMVVFQTPAYEGEAQMLVRALPGDSVFQTQSVNAANAARLIETEIKVLEGTPVEDRVRENLGLSGDIPNVAGEADGQTDVVSIRVRSGKPETAAALADAYMQAYIDVKREQNVNSLLDASAEIQKKVTELQGQINALDEQVAEAPINEQVALEQSLAAQRQLLVDQQSIFKQRLDQIQVDASLQSGSAQPVRPAEIPTEPVEPQPLRTGALALVVGLMLGLGAAFAVEYLDDSVNSTDDLERSGGGLPVLSVVPADNPPDHRPISISVPDDPAVESYRHLRTGLQFIALERPITTIQLTSAVPGEGKTTTTANLALMFAQAGKRVILVDADLRRPRLHQMFGLESGKGLTTALLGEPIDELLQPVEVPAGQLHVLASGTIPGNPSEMLGGNRMRSVIEDLRQRADVVVIDSAPVLPVTDSVVLAGLVDAVVLVAKAHQTSRRQVGEALEGLSRVGVPLVGLVLNKVEAKKGRYGYGYGYGYGYSGGYASRTETPSNPPKKSTWRSVR